MLNKARLTKSSFHHVFPEENQSCGSSTLRQVDELAGPAETLARVERIVPSETELMLRKQPQEIVPEYFYLKNKPDERLSPITSSSRHKNRSCVSSPQRPSVMADKEYFPQSDTRSRDLLRARVVSRRSRRTSSGRLSVY